MTILMGTMFNYNGLGSACQCQSLTLQSLNVSEISATAHLIGQIVQHTHTHTQTHSDTHTHTVTHTHRVTHTHTHTYTHTHTPSLVLNQTI